MVVSLPAAIRSQERADAPFRDRKVEIANRESAAILLAQTLSLNNHHEPLRRPD